MRASVLLEVAAGEPRVKARRRSVPGVVLLVALLYFAWVALLGTRVIALPGLEPTITLADWALLGAVLMVVLLLVLLWDYTRVRRGLAAPQAQATQVPARHAWVPDELVLTAETWQGRRVLEYSRPPKSGPTAAVYAKCYVPVDGEYVLRVEDLVAQARE